MAISRRAFLRSGVSVAAAAAVPAMLTGAVPNTTSCRQRALVVVELNGGNDAINTVIPIADPAYAHARPTLAVPRSRALMLDARTALHPAMRQMHRLYHSGRLAIIQGVGYPNPSRSHFRSMEIFHRGDLSPQLTTGWLGRLWQETAAHTPDRAALVHCGSEMPEMFRAPLATPLAMKFDEQDRLPDDPAGASAIVQVSLANTNAAYPAGRFGAGLAAFAQIIARDARPMMFHISLGGFDTHAKQAQTHAALLGALSSALAAFLDDLRSHGRDRDVMVIVFSEFGRRLKENTSAGTDHGCAGVMFLAGGSVHGGLYGACPSLTDLADGDLKHTVDFRDCYAAAANWMVGAVQRRGSTQFA